MLQTIMACRALPNASAKRNMSCRVSPEPRSSVSQEKLRSLGLRLSPAHGAAGDELAVQPVALDQVFQNTIEESDVAAGVNLEKVVGDFGAKQSALGHRRYPIPLQTRFTVGIDDEHLGSGLLGVVKILGCHRLIIGEVRPHQHEQVSSDPVGIGTSGCGAAHGRHKPAVLGAWQMRAAKTATIPG